MTTPLPLSGFFQQAYITNDLDRALKFYHDALGVKEFLTFDTTPYAKDRPNLVALARAGGVMIELIQPIAEPAPLYADHYPREGFGIRFHHFGYLSDKLEHWRGAIAQCEAIGFAMASISDANSFVEFAYFDARPQLGHFLELVFAHPEGEAFLKRVPQN